MDTIVFSDVDGTLLNSRHEITPYTRQAIEGLHQKGVPFVIISARGPGGIYPIVEQYGLHCAVVAYSGALILDENRRVLAHRGMPKALAGELLACIEALPYDLTWCIYSFDQWLVKDRSHPRIMREESIVKAQSYAGTLHDVTAGEVHKIMCICDPAQTAQVEAAVQAAFPQLSVVKSSDILLEIMAPGITKATAVQTLCDLWQVSPKNCYAFGDNYNDAEMLRLVGHPALMGNAPAELKRQFVPCTADNDHDGIAQRLCRAHLL